MNKYHLFVIEASGKIKNIESLLEEINYPEEYKVVATVGKLYELPEREISLTNTIIPVNWEPIRPQLIEKLRKDVKQASHVFLMTDSDYEGEYIAWQFIKKIEPNSWSRLNIDELNKDSLLKSFKYESNQLDSKKIRSVHIRRGLDRYLGYVLSPLLDKGKRIPIGTVISPLAKIIDDNQFTIGEFKHIVNDNNENSHYELSLDVNRSHISSFYKIKELLKTDDDSKYTEFEIEQNPELLTGGKALLLLSQRLNKSVSEIYKEMQESYENGYISYFRTDSQRISMESLKLTKEIAYEGSYKINHSMIDKAVLKEKVNKFTQDAHEAIHNTKKFSFYIDNKYMSNSELIAKEIFEHNFTELSKEEKVKVRKYELPNAIISELQKIGINNLSWVKKNGLSEHEGAHINFYKDDQIILRALIDNDIARPGSYNNHINKFLKQLWDFDKKTLNQRGLEALITAKNLCPELLNKELVINLKNILDDKNNNYNNTSLIIRDVVNLLNLKIDVNISETTLNKDNGHLKDNPSEIANENISSINFQK